MALISLKNLSYSYAGPMLLKSIEFHIEEGEKIGLLGRNGAGKSTLMKLINREVQPNEGEVVYRQGVTAARLIQEVPSEQPGTCLDIVLGGLAELGAVLAEYHRLLHRMAEGDTSVNARRVETLQHKIDSGDGWTVQTRAESVLTDVGVEPDVMFNTLSGGMKRRVLLARTLVAEPDVLLLDEPTNHLDIHSIRWMESFLANYKGTVIFVTHDRAFLQDLATRIVEVDRGKVVSWQCDYRKFLERREDAYAAEVKSNAVFDKKLSDEEKWIRSGIKARRTRNMGRVRALKSLREERRARVDRQGNVNLNAVGAGKSGMLVSVAEHVSFGYDGTNIIDDLTFILGRGDRIGLIGANGSGKTTLVKLLLGELEPQSGTVKLGTNLEVAYFDQLRETLDDEKSVLENLGIGEGTFVLNGVSKSVMGYLQDFLFDPKRVRGPVGNLSGGEKNRLMLARLFTRPSNVLVLDEPTNDLDIETLELLEDVLSDYKGTVVIISHDRAFINNLSTVTLVLEGDGTIRQYADGYDTWLAEWDKRQQEASRAKTERTMRTVSTKPKAKPAKLTYKEKQLLESLPLKIEELETEQAGIHAELADGSLYRKPQADVDAALKRNDAITAELETVYAEWAALEEKAEALSSGS